MNLEQRNPDDLYRAPLGVDAGSDLSTGLGPRFAGVHTLTGFDVCNRDVEQLGDIKELMLNVRSGRVVYAVLSFGGFLGMGEKLFAVPWSALTFDTMNNRFVLDVDKERLKDAPGFDKGNWPDLQNPVWQKEIHVFYGTKEGAGEADAEDRFADDTLGQSSG
jgi:hypothetical protein